MFAALGVITLGATPLLVWFNLKLCFAHVVFRRGVRRGSASVRPAFFPIGGLSVGAAGRFAQLRFGEFQSGVYWGDQ